MLIVGTSVALPLHGYIKPMTLLSPRPYSPALHTPSPSGSKFKKRAAPSSEESEAFQKCSADLIREIKEPELLAWDLFSSNAILKKQVDEVSMVGLSIMQRKARLLSAVGDQIAVDPTKFQELLKVLGKQPPLKDILDKLEATYRTHLRVGNRGTGLKGLSLVSPNTGEVYDCMTL